MILSLIIPNPLPYPLPLSKLPAARIMVHLTAAWRRIHLTAAAWRRVHLTAAAWRRVPEPQHGSMKAAWSATRID